MSQSPKSWLSVLSLLAVVAAALGYRALLGQAEERIDPYVRTAEPYVEAYCAAQSALASDPFFLAHIGEDAAELLNRELPWRGVQHASTGRLALSDAVRKQVSAWGPHWLEEGARAALPEVDFSWMAALHRYTHWNVASQSPLEGPRLNPHSAPLPDFDALEAWSKLRLLSALRGGDVAAAAADVRRLAQVCWDSKLIAGTRTATRLLRLEWQAWEHLTQAGAAASWKPVPADTLQNLERVSQSGTLFQLAVLPRSTVDRLLACSNPAAGAALLLDQSVSTALRKALEGGDDGRHAAVLAKLNELGCVHQALLYDAWFADPQGQLRDEALEALTAQRGVVGRMAGWSSDARELVALQWVTELLPREEHFQSTFGGRDLPEHPTGAPTPAEAIAKD